MMKVKTLALLLLVLTLSGLVMAENNLLVNGNFEEVQDGKPVGWNFSYRQGEDKDAFSLDENEPYEGKYSARIVQNSQNSYNAITQNVKVEPEKDYVLTAYVRGQNIKVKQGGIGARVFVGDEKGNTLAAGTISAHGRWHPITVKFNSKNNKNIQVLLYLHYASGEVWFDNVKLQKVE